MKKSFIIVIALGWVTHLSAQYRDSQNLLDKLLWDDEKLSIMVDTRIDFRSVFENGETEEASFRGQMLRLWFLGEIVPGIRYRIRHRLNKNSTITKENYSGATDHAWLAFDIGKEWTLTVGKQAVQFGTFEYDYSGADTYLPTMIFDDLDEYKAGINVAYRFARQTINFQVFNSESPQFASPEYDGKAIGISLLWEGSLWNELIKTRWAYTTLQHDNRKFYNWLTAGIQLNISSFTTEMDYYVGNRNMDYGANVYNEDLGLRYVKDQSASLNLKYNFGKWRPFIKGVWSRRYDKDYESRAYDIFGIQAVIELYPFTQALIKDLRFHLMYGYEYTDFEGVFSDLQNINQNTFLVGTRWLFKAK